MIHTWPELKTLALSFNLPEVTLDFPWGNECLKAHGKMWCWWSPHECAAVCKRRKDARKIRRARH